MSSSRAEAAATKPDALHPAQPEFLQIVEEPRFRWEGRLAAEQGIARSTRVRVRSRLTVAGWSGNIDAAARVCAMLTHNALVHGKPVEGYVVPLRLVRPQHTDDLVIEVDDATPDFPGFGTAITGERTSGPPSGLWWVNHYRGRLSWQLRHDDSGAAIGKTVQVVLPPTWARTE